MIKLSTLTVLYTVLFISNAYCCSFDGNETNVGTLNPTSGYQVQANISNGDYFSVNVNCGDSYNFNFCNNGGSSTWDTQLTLLMLDGTTQLAYNDDAACGLPSDVSWTADFTGTIYVLVSQFSCDNTGGSTGATLAYNVTPGTTDPSFTLAVSCGGGVATITGTSGGSFAFNPTPGDGAQVDATTGQISNGTAGSTYTIEYTICSSSSTQSVTVIEDECWTLSGNALNFVDVNGENCIQLTDGSNTGETGCAWNGKQVDFSTDFSLTLDYYFGTGGSNGADGTTFTFQPSSSVACGLDGGQLGAGGIPNSLVIEFDTYDNDNPAHIYDMACDHIALEIDGNLQNTTPFCGPVCAKSSGNAIDDGGTYTIEIRWNAASQQLEIYFDGALRLSCNNDFVSNVFGQNMVYWGASAATGGLVNQQYFCPNTVTVLPIELGEFYSSCSNNTEKLTWTTLSENNVDYFIIEYTYDGYVFYPDGYVDAVGESQSTQRYDFTVETKTTKQRYFRIKIMDIDGQYEYTDLIASEQCNTSSELIQSIIQKENLIIVNTRIEANILLINQLGQQLMDGSTTDKSIQIAKNNLSIGIYYLSVSNGTENYVRKITVY